MFNETEFKVVHSLVRRYLKRTADVYSDSSIVLGLTYEKAKWRMTAMFDQLDRGVPMVIDYTSQHLTVEKDGPWFLIGEGDTPEAALTSLKTRINKLLRLK